MEDEAIWPLCEDSLSSRSTQVIKEDSVKKCITGSLRREDERHIELRKYKSLQIHESCAKKYVSGTKILAYLKYW